MQFKKKIKPNVLNHAIKKNRYKHRAWLFQKNFARKCTAKRAFGTAAKTAITQTKSVAGNISKKII